MKLLILEDDGGSRGILERHLADRGHQVTCCSDVPAAMQELDRLRPEVVLTDIHLPTARGTDHVRAFCEHVSRPLVVVMTGFPSLETCLDSFHFGARGFLVKPFRVNEFIEIAEKGLAERRRDAELEELRVRVAELEARLEKGQD